MEKNLIENLFGIPVYCGQVANSQLISEALNRYNIEEGIQVNYPHWRCDCKTTFNDNLNHKWTQEFYDAIHPNIIEYLTTLKPIDKFEYMHHGAWVNIYDKGDHQEYHSHNDRNIMFSYSYCHKCPKDRENGSDFIFKSPIENLVAYQKEFKEFVTGYNGYIPDLQEGTLLIFPSWLYHMVSPNRTDERRITISGNIDVRMLSEEQIES